MDRNDSIENESSTKSENQTKDANQCSICLSSITCKSETDTCGHQFCFECLNQWSEQHNYCPICRMFYENIKYNIRSDTDYESFAVNNNENQLRQTLITQMHALREHLEEMKESTEREIRFVTHRLQTAEQKRLEIMENIARIDSISAQNNATMRETLEDVRHQFEFEDNSDTYTVYEESVGTIESYDSEDWAEVGYRNPSQLIAQEIIDETLNGLVNNVSDSIADAIVQGLRQYGDRLNSIDASHPSNAVSQQSEIVDNVLINENQSNPETNSQTNDSDSRNSANSRFIEIEVRKLLDQIFSDTIPETDSEDRVSGQ